MEGPRPDRYYATIANNPAELLVVESPDIVPIIVAVNSAIKQGFTVRVSRNAKEKIVEFKERAMGGMQSGEKWGVFTCPECDAELTVTNPGSETQDLELGCENGHAWSIGTAFE